MLGYPHARAIADDEVRIAFTHVDVGVGVRVLHRDPVVLLVAELGAIGALDPFTALRFNTLATQRIAVIDNSFILRAELTGGPIDRQVAAFVRTAAALRRRSQRWEPAVFAFAV